MGVDSEWTSVWGRWTALYALLFSHKPALPPSWRPCPARLPALLACLPGRLPCPPACLPAGLPAPLPCHPAHPPAHLPARLPACLPACQQSYQEVDDLINSGAVTMATWFYRQAQACHSSSSNAVAGVGLQGAE